MHRRDRFDGPAAAHRLQVDVHLGPDAGSTLEADVREGLLGTPKRIPPKHFYDDRGSVLFDRICETPEYYPTRTERALLQTHADELMGELRPSMLVELGSGAARKTPCLLAAAERRGLRCDYVPFDVSEGILRQSSLRLLDEFHWLRIHGVVGDYERHLDRIPRSRNRLFVFLGGTIGNFSEELASRFLRAVASTMGDGDRLLLGTDLAKDPKFLNAAYNDDQGLTEAFNKNVLQVINRELGGDFDLASFEHLAYFREDASQIEMRLRSRRDQSVLLAKPGLKIRFEKGETILTEISRKFTRRTVEQLYLSAGMEMERWLIPANGWFGLSLARKV
jgi:L-histidine N-alpha-methyltransferase